MSEEEGETVEVSSSDSIISIAKEHGFFWKTVWNHGNNSDLRAKRKEPEILQEGDKVYVPKLVVKKVSKASDAKYKFKLMGEQAKFKMQLKRLGEARAGEPFIMTIDGVITNGTTDGDGWVKCDIPNDATTGTVSLDSGKEVIPFTIGRLDPADSPNGVRQRLSNLGFPDQDGGAANEMPSGAIKDFQGKNELEENGKYDDPTKAKLHEQHPS
jgi:hypothetical protein